MNVGRRRVSSAFLFALSVFVLQTFLTSAHPFHADHTDQDFESMDTETLLHVETDLRKQNKEVDVQLGSLIHKLNAVHEDQARLENSIRKLKSGRDWENRKRLGRVEELNASRAEVQRKIDLLKVQALHTHHLKEQIKDTERALDSLSAEKRKIEVSLANPSILDIMDAKVSQLGRTPHNVLNKTIRTLVLPLSSSPSRPDVLYRHMYGPTQHVALASSITIYLTIVTLAVLLYRGYRKYSDSLTITRILFSADMCFSAIWIVVAMWSVALLEDPLVVMRHHNEGLLVAVQLCAGCAFVWYLLIRCISVAATFSVREWGEMVLSLFIIHDYYDRGWAPSIRDEQTSAGPGIYLLYGLGHLILAARRARRQVLECSLPCSPKCEKCQACHGFASDENGLWWCVSQLKYLAAFVESYCFGKSDGLHSDYLQDSFSTVESSSTDREPSLGPSYRRAYVV